MSTPEHGEGKCDGKKEGGYERLKEMARAVAQYVFAALLALLSTQAAVPSVRVVSAIEIVCCAEAEQQAPAKPAHRADVIRSPALNRTCHEPVPNQTPPSIPTAASPTLSLLVILPQKRRKGEDQCL